MPGKDVTAPSWREIEKTLWRPPERLTVAEWAEKYRVLSEPAEEKGPLRLRRTPFMGPIMDACLDPRTEWIVLCKPAQIAGTEAMVSVIGYFIHQDPSSVMLVMADEDTALYMSKKRIRPMIESTPELARLAIPEECGQKEMSFVNGAYFSLGWASSVARLASRPIRIMIFDETDKPGYNLTSREAPAISLGVERTETYYNRKIFMLSTPTDEEGNISRHLASCDVIYDWHVPCPDCGMFQPLCWSAEHAHGFEQGRYRGDDGGMHRLGSVVWEGGLRADPDRIEAAGYACGECGSIWTTLQKNRAVEMGKMVPRSEPTGRRKVGFHLNRLYSLLGRSGDLAKLVDDWIRARKSALPDEIQGFVNSTLAEPWEALFSEKKDPAQALRHHLDPGLPPQTAPEDAICLTMGIDVQASGFWWAVRAWSPARTSHLVDYGFSPSFPELENVIFERGYPVLNQGGRRMHVWRAAIDTGGTVVDGASMTERVYGWLRSRSRGIVFGVKGGSAGSARRVRKSIIDKMPGRHGRPIPGGLVLYILDTAAFKEAVHYRLSLPPDEPGAWLLHRETGSDYMEQLLAEYKRKKVRTGKVEWKKKRGVPNHLLDAEVYALAAADDEWDGGIRLLAGRQRVRGRRVLSRGVNV